MKEEGISIEPNILEMIIQYSNGDMRKILNYIQLFRYHTCNKNPENYYSLLRIPNNEYIRGFLEIKNRDDAYSYFMAGLEKGYYDTEIFTQSLYKILVSQLNENKIGEDDFIQYVEKLVFIDKNPKKIMNYSSYVDFFIL